MNYKLLFVLLLAGCASAQKAVTPEDFAKTITAQDLKNHLTIIASAEMEGRNTPSPGLEKAADYISGQFKNFGLKAGNNGSFRQTYSLYKDSAAEMKLTINGKDFQAYSDFAPFFLNKDDLNQHFDEFAFVGYGIVDDRRNDYDGIDVKNKLVVFLNGSPKNYTTALSGRLSPAFTSNKIKIAMEKGAAAIMVITDKLPARVNSRSTYRPQISGAAGRTSMNAPIYYVNENVVSAVSGENLQTVISAVDNGNAPLGIQKNDVTIRQRTVQSQASASNIIGVVEGSDKKDEYVIVTAHYDHVGKDAEGNIYYGADDDGSGTVAVIEMAEAFAKAKKAGKGPRRTVIFMTVSGEEKGLWGSEYYAANPVYPLAKTSANLNIDMIGRIGEEYLGKSDAENYVYIIGDDKLSTDLNPITDMVNNKFTKLKLDRRYNGDDPERFYYRSDHYNFARNGVPAIFYFNGVHADYHKPTDTVDKINFNLLAKRAQLVFHTAWEMANREEMVKRDMKLPVGVR